MVVIFELGLCGVFLIFSILYFLRPMSHIEKDSWNRQAEFMQRFNTFRT